MAHSVCSVGVVDGIGGRVLLFELAGRKPGPISIFAFRPLARQQEINVVQRLGLQRPGQRFGFLVYQLRRAHGLKVSRSQPVVNLRTRGIRNTAPETMGELFWMVWNWPRISPEDTE